MGQGQRQTAGRASSRVVKVQGVGLVAVLLASATAAPAEAQDAPALQEREDIVALIPDDVGPEDIGRLYSATFAPLIGEGNSIRREGGVRVVSRLTTERLLQVVQNEHELAVNARIWHIGGSSSTADVQRHGYYRAWETRRIHEIDSSLAVPAVPAGAEWYISAVYEGRLFEAHFSATAQTREMRLSFEAVAGGASIRDFARSQSLQVSFRTIGLEPLADAAGDALFATTEAEMRRMYTSAEEPRPILVRFSRVPRGARARLDPASPRQVKLVSIRFPLTKRNGDHWDILAGRPDALVNVTQSGRVLQIVTGPDDTYTARVDRVIGESLTASFVQPLVFEVFDRDPSENEDAGRITLSRFPDTAGQITQTTQRGVELTLDIQGGAALAAVPQPAAQIEPQPPAAPPVPSTPEQFPSSLPGPVPVPIFDAGPRRTQQQPRVVVVPPPPVVRRGGKPVGQ